MFFGMFIYGPTGLAQTLNPASMAQAQKAATLFEQGKAYHDGNDVNNDMEKALDFYERASALGSSDARVNLGYMYFTGEGVIQNYSVARQYYLQAANAGDQAAQKNLGLMYEHGLGVKINKKLAQKWYDKSVGKSSPVPKPATKTTLVKPKPKKIKAVNAGQVNADIDNKATDLTKTIPPVSTAGLAGAGPQKQSVLAVLNPPKTDDAAVLDKTVDLTPHTYTVKANARTVPKGVQVLTQAIIGQEAQATELAPRFIGHTKLGLPSVASTLIAPMWLRPLLSGVLLLMAILSAIWFITNLRKYKLERAQRLFAQRFFACYRDSIRGSYLRTPESHRQFDRPYEPWAMTLSALMVRFATQRNAQPHIKCQISARVMKAFNGSPYAARMEVFELIDLVQDRLYLDIEYLDKPSVQTSKPFQFDHSMFTARKKRKNKSQGRSKLRLVN